MDVDYPPFAEEAPLAPQQLQSLQQPDATATSALLALKVSQATRASDEFCALVTHSAAEVRGVLLEEQRQHASMLACHPHLGKVMYVDFTCGDGPRSTSFYARVYCIYLYQITAC